MKYIITLVMGTMIGLTVWSSTPDEQAQFSQLMQNILRNGKVIVYMYDNECGAPCQITYSRLRHLSSVYDDRVAVRFINLSNHPYVVSVLNITSDQIPNMMFFIDYVPVTIALGTPNAEELRQLYLMFLELEVTSEDRHSETNGVNAGN